MQWKGKEYEGIQRGTRCKEKEIHCEQGVVNGGEEERNEYGREMEGVGNIGH